MKLPDELEITPRGALDAVVRVPGSKSYSNRALLIAGLAEGQSRLSGVLDSDDTRVMGDALEAMGAVVDVAGDWGDDWTLTGVGGKPSVPRDTIDVQASGTGARFLTAAMALVPGEAHLDGTARMRQRPIADLTGALSSLGVDVVVEGEGGCPPLVCRGGKPFGGAVTIDASRSSQYVSALLLIAPYATRDVRLTLANGVLVSRPYVELTLEIMRAFGANADWSGEAELQVQAGTGYRARDYVIEPDASTAAYFFAAAAITGGRVRVEGLGAASRQADIGLLDVLTEMGCTVTRDADAITVVGPPDGLRGVDVDMNAMPDAVLAAAVAALFADGPSRIHNVANLRIKETDRLAALETELRKLGADAEADDHSLRIAPGTLRGATIDTYDDHRMAMAFALAGLRLPGVRIRDPACVSKSWPRYFETFLAL